MKIQALSGVKEDNLIERLDDLTKKSDLNLLRPDRNTGGGLTGEVHLLVDGNRKYVVRMCGSKQKAIFYETISTIAFS